ncbi:hypothetical protein CVIRNUC_003029 [Coccomyxa viridis]|uniref:NEDD8-activating enzyme E1 regulatory subunit n=1 Tax=Coccomyxa viridis TaxID=1274662 RepID=A0AAV1I1R5_9CHLO|nr:hypothetical protein CVIRNUC_003029 [Coccomyxa viridis]
MVVTPKAPAKKYDRQLRIWGAHGQHALESARICVLGSGCTATEALKNLVLGGIAGFTIVDDAIVQPCDLGTNFLLESASMGKLRAAAVTGLLAELNEGVASSYVAEAPRSLIENNPAFFADFQLVLATQMREQDLMQLDAICRKGKVPLLIARSYGLVGYLRASLSEQTVIEAKPDNVLEDLRLHQPWPQLQEYADSINLDTADDVTHRHIPYAILLLKGAQQWCAEHSKELPHNSKEKAAFRQMLKSWQRTIDGIPAGEENFDEAMSNAHKLFSPPSIPSEVRAVLEDEATRIRPQSPDFWVLAAALKRFVYGEGGGSLPLEGAIPDMTSTTQMYLQLQRTYRRKAEADAAAVKAHTQALLTSIGRSPQSISTAAISAFVKNARNLRVVRYCTLEEEAAPERAKRGVMRQALAAEDASVNASLYLLLRAVDRFEATCGRFPGTLDGQLEEDTAVLKQRMASVAADTGVPASAVQDDYVEEMVRFGAAEMHVMGAIVGGIAAQEVIKFITRQFVPVPGTLIYNAMGSTSFVFVP